MATIRMNGGQQFDITQTYEEMVALINSGWSGTKEVNDRSTNISFIVSVPNIVAVQQ